MLDFIYFTFNTRWLQSLISIAKLVPRERITSGYSRRKTYFRMVLIIVLFVVKQISSGYRKIVRKANLHKYIILIDV